MLLQRMAALEEMLKLQKTQVYVLDIVRAPPLQAVQFQILYIIFGPQMKQYRTRTPRVTAAENWHATCKGYFTHKQTQGQEDKLEVGMRYHQGMMKFSTIKKIEFTVLTSDWIHFLLFSGLINAFSTFWRIWDSPVHDTTVVWIWHCCFSSEIASCIAKSGI